MSEKKETPSEKFIRLAEARTQKIIGMIRLLGNCSNPYVYEYSEDDVEQIFSVIENELKVARKKFGETNDGKDKFKLK